MENTIPQKKKKPKKDVPRAISIIDFYKRKANLLAFKGEWLRLVGKPELTGSWFVWGNSGNGKTAFALQLAKYFTNFGRVAYNSLEEGASESLRRNMKLAKLEQVNGKLILLDKEPITYLIKRLKIHKSPKIIIIDSLQYSGLNKDSYKKLISRFSNKLFIIISHADGKQPAGRTAKSIKFDANVKIWIEGFKAHAQSRYGGGEDYIIWQKGADEYYVE